MALTREELEIFDEIGHLRCGSCAKYHTKDCPNYHQSIQIARSYFDHMVRHTKEICKSFEISKEKYPFAYKYKQLLNTKEYFEYLTKYWIQPDQKLGSKYISLFLNNDTDTTYYVRYLDYYNNDMFDDKGNIKCFRKHYHKRNFKNINGEKVYSNPIVYEDVFKPVQLKEERD